jgi:peptide/nickel transport system substrate-binding protein
MERNQHLAAANALVLSFVEGRMTRRELIERAGLLGVSLSALAGLLSGAAFRPAGALAQASGELKVAISADIDTTDPHVSQLLLMNDVIRSTVFNSLVKYSPTLDLIPSLAESWTNPDEKTYVFKLRPGVKYHDGTAVQASDVQFSFQRIAQKKTIFSSRVANVASYTVVDPQTIKIALKTVQADFLDGLVLLSIISPAIATTVDKTPVGTGPFKFVEWVTNDHISLEANPNYFEPGVPGVAKLTFQEITQPQVEIANLQSKTVEAVHSVPIAQAVPLKESSSVKAVIVPTSSIQTFELMGKNSAPLRTNPKVRQALAYCLDKEAVQRTVFSGEGKLKWSWVPTSSWAYKNEVGYPYDPEKAKSLLKEAGVSNLRLTVIIPAGYPDGVEASTIWQAGLAKAGVSLKQEVQELSVWVNNYVKHTYDVTWNTWPGFADPNYFVSFGLKPLWADTWNDAAAAKLGDDANGTLDRAKRKALYGQLQDIFVQEMPVIVIAEVPDASLTLPTVTGWDINPVGFVLLDKVRVG